MSDKINFDTERAPRMSEAFSQSVIMENFIFLSGMPGLYPLTRLVVSNNFEDHLRQSFLNIKIILEDAGSDLSKIIKTTIFMGQAATLVL